MELNDCNCITEFRDCLHIVQVVPWKIPSLISAKYYKIKSKKWVCLFQLSFFICHLNCLRMLSLMKIISECMRILFFLCITGCWFDKTQTLTPVDTSAKSHNTLFLIILHSCIFSLRPTVMCHYFTLCFLFLAAYSGLRPTQSFKERSPSTGVPLRNQVTSSPPGVSAPLSAIPDSSEPDDNQVRMHWALGKSLTAAITHTLP